MTYILIALSMFFVLMVVLMTVDKVTGLKGEDMMVAVIVSAIGSLIWIVSLPLAVIGGTAYLLACGLAKVIKRHKEKKV